MVDEKLSRNPQPVMVAASGMLHFCSADYRGARQRFLQSLSMDPEDNPARLMLVLIDWLTGSRDGGAYHQDLATADWRSPAEFQGYLLQVLEGRVGLETALNAWTSSSEKSWIHYIGGQLLLRQGRPEQAEKLIEKAVLSADPEGWELLLSRAKLDELRKRRRTVMKASDEWSTYSGHMEHFDQQLKASLEARKKRQEELGPLWMQLANGDMALEDRGNVLRKIIQLDPENRTVIGTLAYADAASDAFPEALDHLRAYLTIEGRQTAMRMSLGLLEAGILHYQGQQQAASERLADFGRRTRDPWFLAVSDYLRGRMTEDALRQQAGDNPESILTAFTAVGFWAEGSKDKKTAMRFYREAIGSLLDNWIEYDFVRERIKRLKRVSD